MKRTRVRAPVRCISAQSAWAAGCVALILLACGCGPSTSTPPQATDARTLRGQPIQPAPTPAAAAAATNVAQGSQAAALPAPASPPASAAAASPTAAEPARSSPAAGETEYVDVGFDKLSNYEIEITDEILNPPTNNAAPPARTAENQIPQPIKDLNKKRVAVKGFMLPLKVEGGLVTELLVMKDQSMCCYGTTPRINEWISVKMVEKGVKPLMDQPITLFGRLNVGEMRENGYLVGIYSLDGEKMAGPLDQ